MAARQPASLFPTAPPVPIKQALEGVAAQWSRRLGVDIRVTDNGWRGYRIGRDVEISGAGHQRPQGAHRNAGLSLEADSQEEST